MMKWYYKILYKAGHKEPVTSEIGEKQKPGMRGRMSIRANIPGFIDFLAAKR